MTRPADPARPDIYARITNQIIDQLRPSVSTALSRMCGLMRLISKLLHLAQRD